MPITLAAYFHDLSPFIVRFSDSFGVRWYGVSYVVGFILGYLVLRWLANRGVLQIPASRVADCMMWIVGCILIGGRLAYCIVYDRELFTHFSPGFPFWGVLQIHKGGMASHGGILGAVVAGWRISRGFVDPATGQRIGRCHPMHILDAMAMATPIGLMCGRLANFINGELLGKVYAPPGEGQHAPWWTVQFPQELVSGHTAPLSPEQAAQLHALAVQQVPPEMAKSLAPELLYKVGLDELVQTAARHKAELMPLISARYPSQLFQAFAEGPLLLVLLWAIWAKPRKTGIVGGFFVLGYGVQRIVTEFWRLPDAQFGADGRPYGLSRGQWLSVLMVVIGAAIIVWAIRRPGAKVGGWLRGSNATPHAPS